MSVSTFKMQKASAFFTGYRLAMFRGASRAQAIKHGQRVRRAFVLYEYRRIYGEDSLTIGVAV